MSGHELHLEQYTPVARNLLARAQVRADAAHHVEVTPLHLFAELLTGFAHIFRTAGSEPADLLARVEIRLSMAPCATVPACLDRAMLGLLGRAERAALASKAAVGVEHVAGALFEEQASLDVLAGARIPPQEFVAASLARPEPPSEVAYFYEGGKLLRRFADRVRAARGLSDDDATQERARRLLDTVEHQLTCAEGVPDLDVRRETPTRIVLTRADHRGAIGIEWQSSVRMIVMTSRASAGGPTRLSRYTWLAAEGRWAGTEKLGGFFEDLVATLNENLYGEVAPECGPSKASKTTAISELRERLEAPLGSLKKWMTQHAPLLVENLADGAPASRLDDLERELGFSVPLDLRELWSIHDGQKSEQNGFVGALDLFGVELSRAEREGVLALVDFLRENPSEWGQAGVTPGEATSDAWLPFAGRDSDYLVVSCDTGRVFTCGKDSPPLHLVAASVAEWLEHYAARVYAGAYQVETGLGDYYLSRTDGMH